MPNFFHKKQNPEGFWHLLGVEEIKDYAWTAKGNDGTVGEGQRNIKPDRYAAMRESEWQWLTCNLQLTVNGAKHLLWFLALDWP